MPPLDAVGDKPGHLSACWLPRDSAERARLRDRVLNPTPASTAGA
jgi:hypothetical protein